MLRPRGALVIFWNIPVEFAHLGDEAEAVIDEAFERGGVPGLPRVLSGEWQRPVEDGPFEELREAEVEREILNTRDEWIANLLSVSSIAHQPEEDRAAFASRLRELVPADREVQPPHPHRRPLDAPCLSSPSASAGSPPSTTTCGRSTRPRRSIAPRRRSASAPTRACVDLAAGSGKLTRALAPRFAEVVAVEPNDDMRAVLAGRSADVRVLAGTAERMPLPDDSADAVFVGDAFHWFDGAAAVAELDRVLRPGGGVALLWNRWWERRRRRDERFARATASRRAPERCSTRSTSGPAGRLRGPRRPIRRRSLRARRSSAR